MSIDKAELTRLYSLLDTVKDPEIGISIVKLNMISNIEKKDDTLLIWIKLTVPGCPLASTIEKDVNEALKNSGYSKIELTFGYMTREELAVVKKELYGNSKSLPPPIEKYDKKNVKNIIAVYSAKGGVGKSSIVAMLALEASRLGYKTAILDCDISGPSIQAIVGSQYHSYLTKDKKFEPLSLFGIKIMSISMLTDTEALIWRGPLVSNAIKQMYSDTDWGELDFMFLDLPPGTSDGPLTVFQSIPVDKILLVTTPQNLSQLVGKKTTVIADALKIPVAGIIENMSYIICDYCGEKMDMPTDSGIKDIPLLAKLPFKKELSTNAIKSVDTDIAKELDSVLIGLIKN